MKIILDESVPEGVAYFLRPHDVTNTRELGIKGTKNGRSLDFIEQGKFETFLTCDKRMENEQDFSRRPFAILLLSTNNWKLIRPNGAAIARALNHVKPGQLTKLDCGQFVPKKFRP